MSLGIVLDVFDQTAFYRSGIDFYATVTNVETGEPEYVLIKDGFAQMEALRASGSMPFVSKIVEYSGAINIWMAASATA